MDPREIERWLQPDWRAKLEAWWEGYDLGNLQRQARTIRSSARDRRPAPLRRLGPASPLETRAEAPAPASDPVPEPLAGDDAEARGLECMQLGRDGWPVWSVERVHGAQMLWGDGAVGPGDAAWMLDALRPFGLNAAKSVLDLSAGLGGTTRAIAGAFDTWVTGLEPSPLLARMAMKRSRALEMDKKAPVVAYDPEQFRPAGSYDLVLADRIVHRVHDKEFFLDNLAECVKPKGSVLMFDYVIEGTPPSWDAWNAWKNDEPLELFPWTTDRMKDELTQRNLDLRIAEDLTAVVRRQIVDRVRRLAEFLQSATGLDGRVLKGLARELSLWWARLRVLGQGLGFYRFVALKPA